MEKDLTTQEQTKICHCCEQEMPVSEFPKNKRSKDGLNIYCKECQNAKMRENRRRRNHRKTSTLPPPSVIPDDILDGIGEEYVGKPIQRRTPLSAYTPRELMLELKRRRFIGHLEWVPPTPKPRKINLADIE